MSNDQFKEINHRNEEDHDDIGLPSANEFERSRKLYLNHPDDNVISFIFLLGSGSEDEFTESDRDIFSALSEEYSEETDFDAPNTNNDLYYDRFLSQLTNFIHAANLNKTTTQSLLALLRSTCSLRMDNIPKSTNALRKTLGVSFTYKASFYCSSYFQELHQYQDICSSCNTKKTPNSELYVFSIEDELERIVCSHTELIKWYSLPKNHITTDIVNGKSLIISICNERLTVL